MPGLSDIMGLIGNLGALREQGENLQAQFPPEWLLRTGAAFLKQKLVDAVSGDAKIDLFAKRLGVEPSDARIIWDAVILHLREDY